MALLPLVIFLTLTAGPDRTIPPGCRADYETCHEDCTIDYGGVTTKYKQLNVCVADCLVDRDECTSRHYSLRDAQVDDVPANRRQPSERYGLDSWESTPSTKKDEPNGNRRGVYRAQDEDAVPREEPAPRPRPRPEPEYVAEPEPEPAPRARPAPEPEYAAEPVPATPAKATRPASELPAKTTRPASASSEDIPVFGAGDDDEAPPPPPRPAPVVKPSEPLRPTPPPEPKKKDISDWDPNAD